MAAVVEAHVLGLCSTLISERWVTDLEPSEKWGVNFEFG